MEVSLGAAGPPPHTGKGGGSARRAPGSLRGALEQRQPPSGAGDDVHVLEHPSGPRTISGGRRGMHDKTTQSPTELSTISEPHASVTPQERRSRSGCNTSSALGISRLQQDLISDAVVPECVGCCVPCMLSGGARSSESERRSTEQWSEAGRARTLDGGPRDPISSAGSIWRDGDSGGKNLILAGSVRCCPPAVCEPTRVQVASYSGRPRACSTTRP